MEVVFISFFGLFSLMMGFMLWWIYHISERLRLTEEREIRRRGEEIRIRIRMANGQLLAMALDSSSEMDSEDEEVEYLVLTSPMSTEAIMVWLFTADQLFYPQLKGAAEAQL